MPSSWEDEQRRAYRLGYESAYERRQIRAEASQGNTARFRRRVEELEEEGDFASVGLIFKDVWQKEVNRGRDPDAVTVWLRGIVSP